MAYTTLAAVSWGTGPKIPITFYYDRQRSGTAMQYKIKVVVGTVTGSAYFGYPIYTTISLDGTAKVSGHTIKSASPSQWSSAITYETGWLTVSGKTTGTTALSIRMYSGSGSSRSTTYDYSLVVSPALTTPTFSASTVEVGGTITITLNRASSSFTHRLYAHVGQSMYMIADGVGTSYAWAIPVERGADFPDVASVVCTIECLTYDSGTYLGTVKAGFTLKVPDSAKPTITSVSITEAVEGLAAQFNAFVQNKSRLAVAITASGAYGSTIKSYETTINTGGSTGVIIGGEPFLTGTKYTTASFTSAKLQDSGTVHVNVKIKDSRGRWALTTYMITVLEYFAPKINSMRAYRIDTSGNVDDEGDRIAVEMDFEIAEVGTRNNRTFSLQYKKESDPDTSFEEFSGGVASWTYSGTQNFTSAPEISTDYAYTIRLRITDYFGTAVYTFPVSTAFTLLDSNDSGKGLAIGKVSEKDAFEVALPTEFTDTVDMDIPLSVESGGTGFNVRRTSFALTSTVVNNLTQTVFYYPFLGVAFARIYFTLKTALTAGTLRDVLAVPAGFRPSYRHALSIHTGAAASAEAVVAADGLISMRSNADLTTSNAIYITGFWFIGG